MGQNRIIGPTFFFSLSFYHTITYTHFISPYAALTAIECETNHVIQYMNKPNHMIQHFVLAKSISHLEGKSIPLTLETETLGTVLQNISGP